MKTLVGLTTGNERAESAIMDDYDYIQDSYEPLRDLANSKASLLVIQDHSIIHQSYGSGPRPLLELIDWFPAGLDGMIVADRVVGVCAARVFVHLRVTEVFALVGSIGAARCLHEGAIPFEYELLVPEIRNRTNTAVCPLERLSQQHPSVETLIPALRLLLKSPS